MDDKDLYVLVQKFNTWWKRIAYDCIIKINIGWRIFICVCVKKIIVDKVYISLLKNLILDEKDLYMVVLKI